MNPVQHTQRLLHHVDLSIFQRVLRSHFGLILEPPEVKGARQQKKAFIQALSQQNTEAVSELEKVVEKILLLCDGPGKDAMEAIRYEALSEADNDAFGALRNQYVRSLWLYDHSLAQFQEALDKRQREVLRRSRRTCAGYLQPKHQAMVLDEPRAAAFREELVSVLQCPASAIAIKVFRYAEEGEPGEVAFYEARLHYNLPPESIERVEQNELVSSDILFAATAFVTYEPDTGILYVMSEQAALWPSLASAVCEHLMDAPFDHRCLEAITYDIKKLSDPALQFDCRGLDIQEAKVTQLGVRAHRKVMTVNSPLAEPESVHEAGALLTRSNDFSFDEKALHKVVITLKIQSFEPNERSRIAAITLTGDTGCSLRFSREVDQRRCQRFLELNGLIVRSGGQDDEDDVA